MFRTGIVWCHQTKQADGIIIAAGDFNETDLRPVLSNILDHVYKYFWQLQSPLLYVLTDISLFVVPAYSQLI